MPFNRKIDKNMIFQNYLKNPIKIRIKFEIAIPTLSDTVFHCKLFVSVFQICILIGSNVAQNGHFKFPSLFISLPNCLSVCSSLSPYRCP